MKFKNHPLLERTASPLLIILSGLSGAGKDAVLARIKESNYKFEHIITVTTREPRSGEANNVDYHFVTREEFRKLIARNELLEWARVYENYYGVPRNPVRQALEKGQDALVKVDVQGAITIKKILPQAVFIFLTMPTIEEAVSRLQQRNTETPEELSLRVKTAEEEIRQVAMFDYLVFNRQGEIDRAVADILAVIKAEKLRVHPRKIIF